MFYGKCTIPQANDFYLWWVAGGMGIYYKSYSAMHIIQPGIVPQYLLNVQFLWQMTFIYGGATCGMGISSEKGTNRIENLHTCECRYEYRNHSIGFFPVCQHSGDSANSIFPWRPDSDNERNSISVSVSISISCLSRAIRTAAVFYSCGAIFIFDPFQLTAQLIRWAILSIWSRS